MRDQVTIYHPTTGGSARVHPRSVETWERAGWTTEKPAVERAAEPAEPPTELTPHGRPAPRAPKTPAEPDTQGDGDAASHTE